MKILFFLGFLTGLLMVFSESQGSSVRCQFRVDLGHCKDKVKMFAYDPFDQMCKEFHYGGCGGNPNRFETFAECVDVCKALNVTESLNITQIDEDIKDLFG